MKPLLDNNFMAGREVIQACAHAAVPPIHRARSLRIRQSFIDAVWVVDDHIIAALASPRIHGHHYPIPSSGVFEPGFLVLVVSELVQVTPPLGNPRVFEFVGKVHF